MNAELVYTNAEHLVSTTQSEFKCWVEIPSREDGEFVMAHGFADAIRKSELRANPGDEIIVNFMVLAEGRSQHSDSYSSWKAT